MALTQMTKEGSQKVTEDEKVPMMKMVMSNEKFQISNQCQKSNVKIWHLSTVISDGRDLSIEHSIEI